MGVSGPDGHHSAPGTTSPQAPAAAGTLDRMTTIQLAWVTTARSGMSGTVTFTPTRRYWREDTRVADEAASVTVNVPESPGTATVDLDPTGDAWCYAVTWAPDGPLATEWTEYVTVPVPPAGDPLGAIPYRDLLKLTRDAAAVLTGEAALTAAAALARVKFSGDEAARFTSMAQAETARITAAADDAQAAASGALAASRAVEGVGAAADSALAAARDAQSDAAAAVQTAHAAAVASSTSATEAAASASTAAGQADAARKSGAAAGEQSNQARAAASAASATAARVDALAADTAARAAQAVTDAADHARAAQASRVVATTQASTAAEHAADAARHGVSAQDAAGTAGRAAASATTSATAATNAAETATESASTAATHAATATTGANEAGKHAVAAASARTSAASSSEDAARAQVLAAAAQAAATDAQGRARDSASEAATHAAGARTAAQAATDAQDAVQASAAMATSSAANAKTSADQASASAGNAAESRRAAAAELAAGQVAAAESAASASLAADAARTATTAADAVGDIADVAPTLEALDRLTVVDTVAVTARNEVPDPLFLAASSAWQSRSQGAGYSSWTASDGVATVTLKNAVTGAGGVLFEGRTMGDYGNPVVTPGEKWTASITVGLPASAPAAMTFRVSVGWGPLVAVNVTSYTSVTVQPGQVARASCTSTAPADRTTAVVAVRSSGDVAAGTVFTLSKPSLVKGETAQPFITGDMPDTDDVTYAWEGEPHRSASVETTTTRARLAFMDVTRDDTTRALRDGDATILTTANMGGLLPATPSTPRREVTPGNKVIPLAITAPGTPLTLAMPDGTARWVRAYAHAPRRVRVHVSNSNAGNSTSGAGATLTGLTVGVGTPDGALFGAVRSSVTGPIPGFGASLASEWLTIPTLKDGEGLAVTVAWTGASTLQGAQGGGWTTTGADPAAPTVAGWTRSQTTPFHVWVEAEVPARAPVVLAHGDSITIGTATADPVGDAWVAQLCRQIGAMPVILAQHGSAMPNWSATSARWGMFGGFNLAAVVDAVVTTLGQNDLAATGMDLATMKSRHETMMGALRQVIPDAPVFLGQITPSNKSAALEALRREFNAYRATMPMGERGVIPWATVVGGGADEDLAPGYSADGLHPNTAGQSAMAQVAGGARVVPVALTDAQLAKLMA